jgi:adenine-specific DNA-methyltransferase
VVAVRWGAVTDGGGGGGGGKGQRTVHRVLMADDKTMWLCFETYSNDLKDEIVKAMPAQVVMLNSCFVGAKADEQLANLQLELAGLDIGLTVI